MMNLALQKKTKTTTLQQFLKQIKLKKDGFLLDMICLKRKAPHQN